MKKFRLILLFLLIYATGYSQALCEGFEDANGAIPVIFNPPSTVAEGTIANWPLQSGTWQIFNPKGSTTWARATNTSTTSTNTGNNAAYLQRQNLAPPDVSEDWLVTPPINVSGMSGTKLKFNTRLTVAGDQNSTLKVMVSTTAPTGPAGFTQIQTWTETQLNTSITQYKEVVVDLSAYTSGNIYVAFVMIGATSANGGGDRWLIDDVFIGSTCANPTNLAATDIGLNSAKLTWDNVSGVSQYEVEYVLDSEAPTGTGTIVNQNYLNTGALLQADSDYKFYIRSKCSSCIGNSSQWIGPFFFTTLQLGEVCASPIVIPPTLPFIKTKGNFTGSRGYSGNPGTGCGVGSDGYLNGLRTVYSYTPPAGTTSININVQTRAQLIENTAVFVYDSCSNFGVNCFASNTNTTSIQKDILNLAVTPGTTYYIVVAAKISAAYHSIAITQSNCVSNIAATFDTQNDCSSTPPFYAKVNITSMGGASSLELTPSIDGTLQTSTKQTVSAAGQYTFGPYDSSINEVQILVQSPQNPSCFILSGVLTRKACPPANDECANAVTLTPGTNGACTTTAGTLLAATVSPEATNCLISSEGDVWYEFTAQSTKQFINISGLSPKLFLSHAVYTGGTCGSLTQLYCASGNQSMATNLVVGQVYKIRVFNVAFSIEAGFNICVTGFPVTCADSNPQGDAIKSLLKDLVNYLVTQSTTSTAFTCPQLTALAPYITDADPKIYNFLNSGTAISFSFANHNGTPDVFINLSGVSNPISEINLLDYAQPSVSSNLYVTFSDGSITNFRNTIQHIDFCSNACAALEGYIKPANTLDCVLVNVAAPFSFQTSQTGITNYQWTFYDTDGTTVLTTSTLANPSYTYTAQGSFNIKLVVNYGEGCTETFYKIISVKTDCTSCIELSIQTPNIKLQFTKFITNLRDQVKSGAITNGMTYTSPELQSISKHIVGNSAVINNIVYDPASKNLKFNFLNSPDNGQPSVSLDVDEKLSEFNIAGYKTENISTLISVPAISKQGIRSNLQLRDINLCDEIICESIDGQIGLPSGISCVLLNNAITFNFTGNAAEIATYKWTFYALDNVTVLATGTTASKSYSYAAAGNYKIKLELYTRYGCKFTVFKTVTVSTNCGTIDETGDTGNSDNHCVEFNALSANVRQLYMNFLNSLLPKNDVIANGYTNAELTALAPYISTPDPAIYNVTFASGVLSFSFSQSATIPDVIISNHSTITDINLFNYTNSTDPDYIVTYADGTQYLQHKARHIKFCPENCVLKGSIKIANGASCVLGNTPVQFSFETTGAIITGYEWTFYGEYGQSEIETSTLANPSITYMFTGYPTKIKLVVTYGNGCTSTFYKTITVGTNCTSCTETSTNTPKIKEALITLVNKVYAIYQNGGSITGDYTSPELTYLSSFVVGNSSSINNVTYNQYPNQLQFTFLNGKYVSIAITAPITDIDMSAFTEDNVAGTNGFPAVQTDGEYTYLYVEGINVCNEIQCSSNNNLFGDVVLNSGLSCIVVNEPIKFVFNGNSSYEAASFAWTFYDLDNTTVLAASDWSTYIWEVTYDTPGNYLAKLNITTPNGCLYTIYKTITVSADCGVTDGSTNNGSTNNHCTELNAGAANVRQLYIDFLNSLLALNGNIPNGYTNTELSLLTPFIGPPNPAMYNISFSNGNLSFSFSQSTTVPDVIFSYHSTVTDINLFNYTSVGNPYYIVTYADGTQQTTHKAKNINFCPDLSGCMPLKGKISIDTGLRSKVLVGVPTKFNFSTLDASTITHYKWTLYKYKDYDEYPIAVSTLAHPIFTVTDEGIYYLKLVVTYSYGCTATFYKTIHTENYSDCTDTNPKSEEIKQLLINLINHLYNLSETGATIPNGYTCPELTALAPYISVENPQIWNFQSWTDSEYSYLETRHSIGFSFKDYGEEYYDNEVYIVMGAELMDIGNLEYQDGDTSEYLAILNHKFDRTSTLRVTHINLCPDIVCPPLAGNIKLGSGLSCIPVNTSQTFEFTGTDVTSYKWTFYNTVGNYIFSTNNNKIGSMTYSGVGNYLVKLEVTNADGCNYTFYKTVTVSTDCGNSVNHCTESNTNSAAISHLYVNLLNSLIPLNGNIPNGYTNAPLIALTPYITDPSPAIYNINYNNDILSFSFGQNETQPDVVIANYSNVVDINLTNYTAGGNADLIITYADGSRFNTHKAKHIDFCSDIAPCTSSLFGDIHLGSGISCTLANVPQTYNFSGIASSIGTYAWTFYNADGTFALFTSNAAAPSITYPATGNYLIKLQIAETSGCMATYYKTVTVSTSCGNDDGQGNTGNNPNTCTEVNADSPMVRQLYMTFLNSILPMSGNIPNGYTNNDLSALSEYLADMSPAVYNVNYNSTSKILSFSFSQNEAQPDVVIANYGKIVDINLVNYTANGTADYIVTYADGRQYKTHKAQHIKFCPEVEPCHSHTAFVIDESASLDETEKSRIKIMLRKFITEQMNSDMTISFTGMSDSDNYTRTDHVYGKITAETKPFFDNWINQYGSGYANAARPGVSPNSDYWLSGLTKAMQGYSLVPDVVIILSDGSQTANIPAFREMIANIKDNPDTHLYVYGISQGYYVDGNNNYNLITVYSNDMESTTDWPVNTDYPGYNQIIFDSSTAHSGTSIKVITPPTAPVQVSYVSSNTWTNIDNQQPTAYTVSGWIKSEYNAGRFLLFMKKQNETDWSSLEYIPSEVKPGWQFVTKTIWVPADIKQLRVRLDNLGSGDVWFDDVKIVKNEPVVNPNSPSYVPSVSDNLTTSLKFLMQLLPTDFPISNDYNLLSADYYGTTDFNAITEDRFFSNRLADANIGCGGEAIPKDYCNDCQTFQPAPGQTYWLSAWAKEEQSMQVKTYTNAVIKIVFENQAKQNLGEIIFTPTGEIIDGWQRFASKFEIPPLTTMMRVELENLSSSIPVYFDDIRIHPIQGSVKSFVYDPETFRLMAEQDDNNYSTFYEYDNEGGLIRIKKETSRGIKTIQESRSGSVIQQTGN